jgi:hypothetical protein
MRSHQPGYRLWRIIFILILLIPLFLISGLYIQHDWRSSQRQIALMDSITSQLQTNQNISRTLVIGRTKSEDISWVQKELPADIKMALYSVDDPTAPLHTNANKGHEAMVYLSYIIEHYDKLSDVTMFFHAHQKADHNNLFLENDSARTIRQLDLANVMKSGYINTRCELKYGCPAGPFATEVDFNKPEEKFMTAETWSELNLVDTAPTIIGVSCCAQFAVSRNAILARPLSNYIHYRDWLLNSTMPDSMTGRVFEYSWHFIFGGVADYCPDERDCLFKSYGILFNSMKELEDYRAKWTRKEMWIMKVWWMRLLLNTEQTERELDAVIFDATRRGYAKKQAESVKHFP